MSQRLPKLIPHPQVTTVSQRVPGPTVNNPSFFQKYYENHVSSSTIGLGPSAQNFHGYSPAHLQYQDERKRWAAMAYKTPGQIPFRAQARQEIRVLFQLSHQLLNGKVEKVMVLIFILSLLFFIDRLFYLGSKGGNGR